MKKLYIFSFKDGSRCIGYFDNYGNPFDMEDFQLDEKKIIWCDNYEK